MDFTLQSGYHPASLTPHLSGRCSSSPVFILCNYIVRLHPRALKVSAPHDRPSTFWSVNWRSGLQSDFDLFLAGNEDSFVSTQPRRLVSRRLFRYKRCQVHYAPYVNAPYVVQ